MPLRQQKPCAHIGCPNLTRERYCDQHKQQVRRYDRERGTAAQRGYDSRWRKARLMFLRKHPLCVDCMKQGRVTPATDVDHIVPHRGNRELFWDESNWQALCHACHSRKTAREDGGFGRTMYNYP
jgi:5-methylcytosine-specific restriction protein A